MVDSPETTDGTRRRNAYRIEKGQHPVILTLLGGQSLVGAMFVQAYARHRAEREDPRDILNEPDLFFPLLTEQGETLLIPKARVLEVAGDIPSCKHDEPTPASPGVAIAVTLVGGIVRTGRVYLDMPGPAPRPLDFLNHSPDRFFALHDADEIRLINRDLIERVHPLD